MSKPCKHESSAACAARGCVGKLTAEQLDRLAENLRPFLGPDVRILNAQQSRDLASFHQMLGRQQRRALRRFRWRMRWLRLRLWLKRAP